MRHLWLILPLFAWACAGDLPPVKSPPPERGPSLDEQRPPAGKLWRHEVDAVVAAGLPRFLESLFQRLDVEAQMDERGAFLGWEVVRLVRDSFWDGIDLREGDVITAVNGMPIERETQAYDAFMALKQSDELAISLLRGGERMELDFKIVSQPGRSAQPARATPASRSPSPPSRQPVAPPPGAASDWPSVDQPMPGTAPPPQPKSK